MGYAPKRPARTSACNDAIPNPHVAHMIEDHQSSRLILHVRRPLTSPFNRYASAPVCTQMPSYAHETMPHLLLPCHYHTELREREKCEFVMPKSTC